MTFCRQVFPPMTAAGIDDDYSDHCSCYCHICLHWNATLGNLEHNVEQILDDVEILNTYFVNSFPDKLVHLKVGQERKMKDMQRNKTEQVSVSSKLECV